MGKVVLITGCSTGIGRALVQNLAEGDYSVVATARNVNSLAELPSALKLALDVTQADTITLAVETTLQRFGRIDVLVNNAGYSIGGAVEEVSDEELRRIYDVNVFGTMRMIRAVAPLMRQQKAGRIINISSIVGKFVVPVNGVYSSTKYALEALSDALRLELAPFGIQTVLVEPGAIKTHFMDTVQTHTQKIYSNPDSPYHRLYQNYQKITNDTMEQAAGAEVAARTIRQVIEASRPKDRYLAGVPFSNRLIFLLNHTTLDFLIKRMLKIGETLE